MGTRERVKITEGLDGITARIKPKKSWFALIYIPFILTAWTVAGILVINTLAKSESKADDYAIVTLWLVFWLTMEAIIIFALLWNICGEEIVSIRDGLFIRKLAVFGVGIKKTFPANEVFNIRTSGFSDHFLKEMDNRFWGKLGMAQETVGVDITYTMLFRFGIRLEDNEAALLAKALRPYITETSNNSFNRTRT